MILDVILLVVMTLGFVQGYKTGIIKTLFNTLSILIGSILSLKLAPSLIKHVDELLNVAPTVSYLIGIVLSFVIVISIIAFVGKQVENLFEAINLDFVNKIVGGVLQSVFYAFLLSLVLMLLDNLSILNHRIHNTSQTYVFIESLPRIGKNVFEAVRPVFDEFWELTKSTFEKIKYETTTNQGYYDSNY